MNSTLACRCASNSTTSSVSKHLYASGNWAALRASVDAPSQKTVKELLTPSLIPTRHFQRSLPKLPLPSLPDTMHRYLEAAQPLCTPSQLSSTRGVASAFAAKEGKHLHEELRRTDKANAHTSFISSDLFEQTLKVRDPLPLLSHSTWLVRPDGEKQDMLVRSAYWIWASVHFYKLYLDNKLAPEVRCVDGGGALLREGYWNEDWFQRTAALLTDYVSTPFVHHASCGHAQPLDMSQFDCLFNCSRMPGVLQDEIKAVGFVPQVAVQFRGHQFIITVADADCVPMSIDEIYAQLREVVHTNVAPPRVDVSVFTALPRTEWNGVRTMLLRDSTNSQSIEAVEESMMVLNLDAYDEKEATMDPLCAVGMMAKWHSLRHTNRWWDKSLSVSVTGRGDLIVSAEASWGDGVAVQRYINDVFALSHAAHATLLHKDSPAMHPLKQLQWHIPADLEAVAHGVSSRMKIERDRLNVASRALDVATVATPTAEATTQLAAQLALWRLQQQPVCCVQEIDMHRYRRGRREQLQLTTSESVAFLLSMLGSDTAAQKEACFAALKRYARARRAVHNGCTTQGHLLALRWTAERLLGRVPDFYRDPTFDRLSRPTLRFELMESPAVYGRSFQLNPSGYHLSCSRTGPSLLFQVSSISSAACPVASSTDAADAFEQACRDVAALEVSL